MASKTAEKILNQASKMFAEKGYDGTIMDDLAELAQVNKASIYYHFQDKANLYEKCTTQLFKQVVDKVIEAVDEVEGTREKLLNLIISFAEQADAKPQMPAILMREFAAGGLNMPVPARQQMQRTLVKLKEILDEGKKQNIFNTADHFATHIMIVGSICLFVTSQPMRKAIKESNVKDPDLKEAIQNVADIILNGLVK